MVGLVELEVDGPTPAATDSKVAATCCLKAPFSAVAAFRDLIHFFIEYNYMVSNGTNSHCGTAVKKSSFP